MTTSKVISRSPDETREIAAALAPRLGPGDLVALTGELGAGKTCFVQGLASGLGVGAATLVNSPTFTILKEYKGRLPVYHFDAYRLDGADELAGIGYEEYFYGEGVTAVEWADKVEDLIPSGAVTVTMIIKGEKEREIVIRTDAGGLAK